MNHHLLPRIGSLLSGLCLSVALFNGTPVSAYPNNAIVLQETVTSLTGKQILFSLHSNGKICVKKQSSTGVGSGNWNLASENLGNPTGKTIELVTLAAAKDVNGYQWVFGFAGGPTATYRIWYKKSTSTGWSAWTNLPVGGAHSFLKACDAIDSRGIQLLTRSSSGNLMQMQISASGTVTLLPVSGFVGVNATILKKPAPNNCMVIFSTASDGVYYACQSAPYGTFSLSELIKESYIDLEMELEPDADIKCIQRASGKVEVFAYSRDVNGSDNKVIFSFFQNDDGTWSNWYYVVGDFAIGKRFDVATRQDGGTEVIYTGYVTDGSGNYYLYRVYRNPPESDWVDGAGWSVSEQFYAGSYLTIKPAYKDKNRVSFQKNTAVNYLTVFAPDNISTTEKKFNYSSWTPSGNWATIIPLR